MLDQVSFLRRGLAVCAGLCLLAEAVLADGLQPGQLAALGIETSRATWRPAGTAAVDSRGYESLDLQGRRGERAVDDVVAVLGTIRTFEDDDSGEQRRRLLRVFRVKGGRAELTREIDLGDPSTYVGIEAVADFDGDLAAEVLLAYRPGGSGGGTRLELLEPFETVARAGVVLDADCDYGVVDVDGDQRSEVVVTSAVDTAARPQCNAERVFVESLYEYRPGTFTRVADARAGRFHDACLAQAQRTRAAVSSRSSAPSIYILEALDRKIAALHAAASGR